MGQTMTTTALSDRRARLKLLVSEQAETEAIERILRKRLRERREVRGARDRRQAHGIKGAHWLTIEQALKIEGTTDPTRLRMELKQGLPCKFRNRGRWWQFKPVEEIAPLLAGRNPLDLQDDQWELVIRPPGNPPHRHQSRRHPVQDRGQDRP